MIIKFNGIYTTHNLSWRMKHKLLWDFEIQRDHLILARQPDLIIISKKEGTFRIVDFALFYHVVKLKESENRGKYPELARELKKNLWNI